MSLCSELPGLVKESPARSRAICATCGAAIRHGPHHDARKSVNTRDLAVANDLAEFLFVDFEGLAEGRQLCLVRTAFPYIGEVLCGYAVGSATGSAISNQRHEPVLGQTVACTAVRIRVGKKQS